MTSLLCLNLSVYCFDANRDPYHRYGTTFAFATQISLVGSVGFAYSQWLWKTLRATTVSVQCLDSAFSADTQLISMFNPEMWWKIKLGSLLALLAW